MDFGGREGRERFVCYVTLGDEAWLRDQLFHDRFAFRNPRVRPRPTIRTSAEPEKELIGPDFAYEIRGNDVQRGLGGLTHFLVGVFIGRLGQSARDSFFFRILIRDQSK
jgi:hypothetical protein